MMTKTYLTFFGLKDEPFRLTPDTRYFFPSEAHKGVLEVLDYGLRTQEGFLVLTGEPGTGKTMLLRLLLKGLSPEVESAVILTPTLYPKELIEAILDDLGLPYDPNSSKEWLLRTFKDYLLAKAVEGKSLVVIIDEAQNLPEESLEELRLLSNLELDDRKLIQIILAGQPPLLEKLTSENLTQLAQRISIWETVTPLKPDEILSYVNFRLFKASGTLIYFAPRCEKILYEITQGLPRLINKIMDRVLLVAASKGEKKITPLLIIEAAETFGPLFENSHKPSMKERLLRRLPLSYFNYGFLCAKLGF